MGRIWRYELEPVGANQGHRDVGHLQRGPAVCPSLHRGWSDSQGDGKITRATRHARLQSLTRRAGNPAVTECERSAAETSALQTGESARSRHREGHIGEPTPALPAFSDLRLDVSRMCPSDRHLGRFPQGYPQDLECVSSFIGVESALTGIEGTPANST